MSLTRTLSILTLCILGVILGFTTLRAPNTNKQPNIKLDCQMTNIVPLTEQASDTVVVQTSHGPDKAKFMILTLCVDRKMTMLEATEVVLPDTESLNSKLVELYQEGKKVTDIETSLAREVAAKIRKNPPEALSSRTWIILVTIAPATPWPETTPTPIPSGTTA